MFSKNIFLNMHESLTSHHQQSQFFSHTQKVEDSSRGVSGVDGKGVGGVLLFERGQRKETLLKVSPCFENIGIINAFCPSTSSFPHEARDTLY